MSNPLVAWLPATATVHATLEPGTGRVWLTVTDGDATLALVLHAAQADEACQQLVGSRTWSSCWWAVYDR